METIPPTTDKIIISIMEPIPSPIIDKLCNCMIYIIFGCFFSMNFIGICKYHNIVTLWDGLAMIYFTMKYIIITLCKVLYIMISFTMKYLSDQPRDNTIARLDNLQTRQQPLNKYSFFENELKARRLARYEKQEIITKENAHLNKEVEVLSNHLLNQQQRQQQQQHRQQQENDKLLQENAKLSAYLPSLHKVLSKHLHNQQQQQQEIKKLSQDNAKLNVDLTCVICLDEKRNCCIDCGHVLMCITCSAHINNCPICRKPIINKIKIFVS